MENKFTGQIYQQNHNHKLGETYHFPNKDYYFKTAKVFGKDMKKVKDILEQNQSTVLSINSQIMTIFNFRLIQSKNLGKNNIDLVISSNVVEFDGNDNNIREVNIEWTTPVLFEKQ